MTGVDKYIHKLLEFVEAEYAGTLQTPKDFLCLSLDVKKRTGYSISISTIKRLFGYVKYGSTPSVRTLNTFSQFIGYSDFKRFCSDVDSNIYLPVSRVVLSDKTLSNGDTVMVKLRSGYNSRQFMLSYCGNFKFSMQPCSAKQKETTVQDNDAESPLDIEIVSINKKKGYL